MNHKIGKQLSSEELSTIVVEHAMALGPEAAASLAIRLCAAICSAAGLQRLETSMRVAAYMAKLERLWDRRHARGVAAKRWP